MDDQLPVSFQKCLVNFRKFTVTLDLKEASKKMRLPQTETSLMKFSLSNKDFSRIILQNQNRDNINQSLAQPNTSEKTEQNYF